MGETWASTATLWFAQAESFVTTSPLIASLIATNFAFVALWLRALARVRAARRQIAHSGADHAELLVSYEKEKTWRQPPAGGDPTLDGAQPTIAG